MSLSFFKKCIAATAVVFAFSSFSFAEQAVEKTTVDSAVADTIMARMNSMQLPVTSISPFVVDGLYEVVVDNKAVFYVSADGKYLLDGSILDLDKKVNLTGERKQELSKGQIAANLDKLESFAKDMIVYKADEEKHVITVFTDISCGYCHKLHRDMKAYNKQGITVRYMAFPRNGTNSQTYKSMVSIWCADDQKAALDKGMKGRNITAKECENTVKEQYELGMLLGVNGTPAMILQDGTLLPGYIPAAKLAPLLDKK